MFQTIGLNGWKVKANGFMINDVSFLPAGSLRTFDINSHLPFLYLPDDDWVLFAELMRKNYPDIKCSKALNVCYFQKTCAEVNIEDNLLKLTIMDDKGSMTLAISDKEFFVPG